MGYSDVSFEYNKDYRNCERLLCKCDEFSNVLWNRLCLFLKRNDIENVKPYGFQTKESGGDGCSGFWRPTHINECIRFSKYSETNKHFFKCHKDGPFIKNNFNQSVYTIIVYLNDNFKNGHTIFYGNPTVTTPNNRNNRNNNNNSSKTLFITELTDEIKKGLKSVKIRPKQGRAVIFNHDIWHEGTSVILKNKSQTGKYILRSDVMFEYFDPLLCVDATTNINNTFNISNDPLFKQAEKYFNLSVEYKNKGKAGESTSYYLKGLSIQSQLPSIDDTQNSDNYYGKEYGWFANDVFDLIFSNLEFIDIINVCNVSRAFNYYGKSPIIWKKMFEYTFGLGEANMERQDMNIENNPYIRPWKHLFGFHYLNKKINIIPTIVIVFWLNGIEIGLLDPNIDEYNEQVEQVEKEFQTMAEDPTIDYKNKESEEQHKIRKSFFSQEKNRKILEKFPFVPRSFILSERGDFRMRRMVKSMYFPMVSTETRSTSHIVKSFDTERLYGDVVLVRGWGGSPEDKMAEFVFDSINMSRTYKKRLSLRLGRTRNLLLQNHYQYKLRTYTKRELKKKSKDDEHFEFRNGKHYFEVSKTQTNEQSLNSNEIEWKTDEKTSTLDNDNDGRNEVSHSYSSEMSMKNDLATILGYRKIDNCVDLDLFVACFKDIFKDWSSLNPMHSDYGTNVSDKGLNIMILANDIFDQNGHLFSLKTNDEILQKQRFYKVLGKDFDESCEEESEEKETENEKKKSFSLGLGKIFGKKKGKDKKKKNKKNSKSKMSKISTNKKNRPRDATKSDKKDRIKNSQRSVKFVKFLMREVASEIGFNFNISYNKPATPEELLHMKWKHEMTIGSMNNGKNKNKNKNNINNDSKNEKRRDDLFDNSIIILCEQRGYAVAPIINNKHDKLLSRHYFYKSKKYDERQFPHSALRAHRLRHEPIYADVNEAESENIKIEEKMERLLKRNVNWKQMQSINGKEEYSKKRKFLNEIKEKFSDFELLMKGNIQLSRDEIHQSYGARPLRGGCHAFYIPYVRWHELCYAPAQLIIDLNYVLNEMMEVIGKQVLINQCNDNDSDGIDKSFFIPIIIDGPLTCRLIPFVKEYFECYLSKEYQRKSIKINQIINTSDKKENDNDDGDVDDGAAMVIGRSETNVEIKVKYDIFQGELKRREGYGYDYDSKRLKNWVKEDSNILQQAVLVGSSTSVFENFETI